MIETDNKKKIGLVLGGGGARGLAHIGVLKVLEREKVPVSVIAGTSMGGLIGATYAAGIPPEEIEKEAHRVRKRKNQVKLLDLGFKGSGFIKGVRVYQYIAGMLGDNLTFDDLKIPLAMVAVDLNTGREVVLKKGKVADAIRATISVPGVFSPFKLEQNRLVDGGISNNVPIDVARNLGAEVVIAVDVLPNFFPNQPGQTPIVEPLQIPYFPYAVQEILHVLMIMISELTEVKVRLFRPDILLRPVLPENMGLFSFEHPEIAIAAGEAATEQALPNIRELLAATIPANEVKESMR